MAKAESPCPSCTAFLDGLDGAARHIEGLGFNLVVIAKAPSARLQTTCATSTRYDARTD